MTTDPIPEPVHHDELAELLDFLRKHGKSLATTLVLAVLVSASIFFYRNSRQNAADEAARLYGQARSVQDFQVLVSDYPSSPLAPIAQLGLAKSAFSSGTYGDALRHYETFIQSYPEHEMVPAANVGRLHCLEAMNRHQEALAGFQEFENQHPGHYLLAVVRLGRARCYEAMRAYQQAREAYEEFIVTYADSDWKDLAEQRLEAVTHILETGAKGPAYLTATLPPPPENTSIFDLPQTPTFNLGQPSVP